MPRSYFWRSFENENSKRLADPLEVGIWGFTGAWSLVLGAFTLRSNQPAVRRPSVAHRHRQSLCLLHSSVTNWRISARGWVRAAAVGCGAAAVQGYGPYRR